MRITGPGVWGPPQDHDGALAVLRRVVELGINLIDTADSYGPHVSEELIAEALYPVPRGRCVIATKGGLDAAAARGEWPRNGRPEHLREACERSLRDLRVERIDLYQLHAPDPDVPYEESVGALAELQDEGKIRHIGALQRHRRAARGGALDRRGRHRAEPLQPHRPRVARTCSRSASATASASFPGFRSPPGKLAEPGGLVAEIAAQRTTRRTGQVALAWLLAALAGHAADPRHGLGRAPRGERRRRRARARRATSCSGSTKRLSRLSGPGAPALVGERRRPPDLRADLERQRRDEHRAHDERVEQDAEGDDEADLGEEDERQDAEHGEHAGQHDAGRGDDPAGHRQAAQHPLARAVRCVSSRTRAMRKML